MHWVPGASGNPTTTTVELALPSLVSTPPGLRRSRERKDVYILYCPLKVGRDLHLPLSYVPCLPEFLTIRHLTSAPYHPASNGLAVQIVKKGLKSASSTGEVIICLPYLHVTPPIEPKIYPKRARSHKSDPVWTNLVNTYGGKKCSNWILTRCTLYRHVNQEFLSLL